MASKPSTAPRHREDRNTSRNGLHVNAAGPKAPEGLNRSKVRRIATTHSHCAYMRADNTKKHRKRWITSCGWRLDYRGKANMDVSGTLPSSHASLLACASCRLGRRNYCSTLANKKRRESGSSAAWPTADNIGWGCRPRAPGDIPHVITRYIDQGSLTQPGTAGQRGDNVCK